MSHSRFPTQQQSGKMVIGFMCIFLHFDCAFVIYGTDDVKKMREFEVLAQKVFITEALAHGLINL